MGVVRVLFVLIILISIAFIFIYKKYSFVKRLFVAILLLIFSWIWFVPFGVKERGEGNICKFRLNVYHFTSHDYNNNQSFNDLFFSLKPEKYGNIHFVYKVGGWKEYFGFKPLKVEN